MIKYIVIQYPQRKIMGIINAKNRNEASIKAYNDYRLDLFELKLASRTGKAELQEAKTAQANHEAQEACDQAWYDWYLGEQA